VSPHQLSQLCTARVTAATVTDITAAQAVTAAAISVTARPLQSLLLLLLLLVLPCTHYGAAVHSTAHALSRMPQTRVRAVSTAIVADSATQLCCCCYCSWYPSTRCITCMHKDSNQVTLFSECATHSVHANSCYMCVTMLHQYCNAACSAQLC
jgi:hypothetical protein